MKNRLVVLIIAILCCISSDLCAQCRIIEFDSPKMKVFLPPVGMSTGKAVIACPGGGYSHLARNHEGYHWAPFFNNLGVAFAVVEYRMPQGDPAIPMSDVEKAYRIVADSAHVWDIKPENIGLMGSSAGGHLVSTMATHPSENCKPSFQILFYPVISLERNLTHQGSRSGFLGENPSDELVKEYSSDLKVTSETPRAFIALSSDDKAVKPANSLRYYSALQEAGVPVAMFIYPVGAHGWGYRSKFKYHDQMLAELSAWLESF